MARAAMARAAMRRAAMPRCCRRRSADTAQHESQNENPALRPGANCPGRGHTVSAARRSAGPRDDVRKRPMTVHREDPLIGDFPLQDGEATPERISAYGIRTDPGDILPGAWWGPGVVRGAQRARPRAKLRALRSFLLPGASPGLCNNGYLISGVAPHQPVQRRHHSASPAAAIPS